MRFVRRTFTLMRDGSLVIVVRSHLTAPYWLSSAGLNGDLAAESLRVTLKANHSLFRRYLHRYFIISIQFLNNCEVIYK